MTKPLCSPPLYQAAPLFGPAIVYFRPLLERDLKRAYGRDSLMGELSQEFYAWTDKIQMDTQATRRVSWYAPGRHGKRIPLNRLLGEFQIQSRQCGQ